MKIWDHPVASIEVSCVHKLYHKAYYTANVLFGKNIGNREAVRRVRSKWTSKISCSPFGKYRAIILMPVKYATSSAVVILRL
jgi:hypothetical protein